MKLDAKKAKKKVSRWNSIAQSAAKQARRGKIPVVTEVMDFKEAMEDAKSLDMFLVPYEEAKGMEHSRELFQKAKEKKSIRIIIGPEGGIDKEEIESAKLAGGNVLTLGKRILRTETAGMTMLSILMFLLEK